MIEINDARTKSGSEWCICCQKQTNTKRIRFSSDGRSGTSIVLCDVCRKELMKALQEAEQPAEPNKDDKNELDGIKSTFLIHAITLEELDARIEEVKREIISNPRGKSPYRTSEILNITLSVLTALRQDCLDKSGGSGPDADIANDADLYQQKAFSFASEESLKSDKDAMINGALGLCGESGEASDLIKKAIYHGHRMDREHLAKELGDCLWYISFLAKAAGYKLSDIMEMNLTKLQKRYPNGFSTEESLNRKDGDI